ncbi:MAG TPA: ribonuclease R [Gammaproteobacteria bacterium]|nr:ribonuclease R [Gammaproteobacteria bacterium]
MPKRPDSRQAPKYEHRIPSRDEILRVMEAFGRPLVLVSLAQQFHIRTEPHRKALENRLRAMVRDGQLIRNRAKAYCLTKHLDLVTGRVQAHRDGYGFVIPDDSSDDIYLSAREMAPLWDGDRVAVHASASQRGGREGKLAEILDRGRAEIVGRFTRERGIDLVLGEGEPAERVLIPRGETGGARGGDIVRVEIEQYPTARTDAIGRVIRVVGRFDDPGIETDVAILAYGLPHEWPDSIIADMEALGPQVPASAKRNREDLRKLPLVTIDGADARDFDDAVYAERKGDGWRLIVAIADVAHYVEPGTELDSEARARGTSVYFPDRVLPMLPEVLSNGLCSLNPEVDRLCLCCEMSVDRSGDVRRARFFEGVMRSAARLTYVEVASVLEGSKPDRKLKALMPQLECLQDVYRAFDRKRRRRGAIDFDLPQTKIELDERGQGVDVHVDDRRVSHKIIEECMIAANVEAARRLQKGRIAGLYRIHEGPDPERIDELVQFLQSLGLKLGSPKNLTPKDVARLIDSVADHPEAELIDAMVLRSMSRAKYQPRNVGHFGLALPAYAHFTSPIRRYPDLMVHRAIKWLLRHGSAKGYQYALPEVEHLGEHCSRAERRADEAVWQVEERLKCAYLKSQIGREFEVMVASIVAFGLFVRVHELQIDGLVHVSGLPDDYYHREAGGSMLVGERSGRRFRITDKLKVKLVNVDVGERKIDFVLAEQSDAERPRERPKARRGRR